MNITDHKLVTNLLGTLNNKNKIFVHCCKNESKMKICAIAKIQKTVRVLAIISSQQTLRKLWNMSLSHVLEQVVQEYVVIGQYLKDLLKNTQMSSKMQSKDIETTNLANTRTLF